MEGVFSGTNGSLSPEPETFLALVRSAERGKVGRGVTEDTKELLLPRERDRSWGRERD
jgi:hypothetical protein